MKKLVILLCLILSISIFAQVPSYYNDVDLSLTGNALKNELATKIISTHNNTLSYWQVWNVLKKTDLDPTNSNNVLLIYGYSDTDGNYKTDRTRSKYANGGDAGTEWNREHTYPKALGAPNLGTSGPGADAHHLRAADIAWNSSRSSKRFAAGSGNSGSVSGGWYPGDEWKGDVARMMMYMYLRYGNRCLPTGVGTGSTVSSDSNMIYLFLKWNAEDPVSEFEKQRNPILENIQGNRNPFIDNPAFATKIWGGPQAENLFNLSTTPTTPTPPSDSSKELFISEYIEGSSYNKAIEIANFTAITIDLSKYSLKKASNGGGWQSEMKLSGLIANGKTYVIGHSNASSTLKNKCNITVNNSVINFNGNDAVGLFKNNVLIDVIGNPNNSTYFAKDKTIQRKSSISSPNTNYTSSQWNTLPNNTFSGLGNHKVDNTVTNPVRINYCSSKGQDANYEYIDYVKIGSISNTSGNDNGYKDYTGLVTNLNYGTDTIVYSAGFSSGSYIEYWKVWIDYNQNGVFEDSERLFSRSSSSSSNLSNNFSIPSTAKTGKTRMRISMKYQNNQTACETFDYGEVEDYTVNITKNLARNFLTKQVVTNLDTTIQKEEQFTVYPNPASEFIYINSKFDEVNYQILNSLGRIEMIGKTKNKINLNNLSSGIYYLKANNYLKKIIKK